MQKARSHTGVLLQSGGAWFQGLFHSPRRGSFHLSLAVLVRYRSAACIQPCGVGPAGSCGVSRVPHYSGCPWDAAGAFAQGAVTRSGPPFQAVGLARRDPCPGPPTPGGEPPGLGSSAFARRYLRNLV
jgi:hypothetical protein